jgi:hypothetical protein
MAHLMTTGLHGSAGLLAPGNVPSPASKSQSDPDFPAIGRYRGQETGEPAWLLQVEGCLAPGAVGLGEHCCRAYFLVASLQARGVDYVGRQHQRRKADFRCGQRLGSEDQLSEWAKPARPVWLDEAISQQVPGREVIPTVFWGELWPGAGKRTSQQRPLLQP